MDEERTTRSAVYALARSQLDWIPAGRLREAAPSGFASGKDHRGRELRWETCPDCLTDDFEHRLGCETCGGAGEIPVTHHLASLPVRDGYATKEATRVGGLAGERIEEGRRWADAQLLQLARTERQRRGEEVPEDWLTRALRVKAALWRRGDYLLLDQAQQLLGYRAPLRHFAWVTFVVEAQPLEFGAETRARLDETADWLGWRMTAWIQQQIADLEAAGVRRARPAEIRVPPEHWDATLRDAARGSGRWANPSSQGERNAMIVALAADGQSAGAIARRMGLTKRRVQQVLAERRTVATGPAA